MLVVVDNRNGKLGWLMVERSRRVAKLWCGGNDAPKFRAEDSSGCGQVKIEIYARAERTLARGWSR